MIKRILWTRVLFSLGILLLLTVCAVTAVSAEEDTAPRILNVRDYGAAGDGVTSDTFAILLAIGDLRDGETLYFPKGTYLIQHYGDKDILMISDRNDIRIVLDEEAVIQLDAVAYDAIQGNRHHVFHLFNCHNVTFTGGAVYGDRLRYKGSERVDKGCGLHISDCSNVLIQDVELAYFRGDAVFVFSLLKDENGIRGKSRNVTIDRCHVHDCLRNGITLSSTEGCTISNTEIHDIRGTAPEAGIDIEAEFPTTSNRNVTIENCRVYDNGKISVAITCPSENVVIRSSVLEQQFVFDEEGDGLLLSDCTAGLVCLSGKNAVIEDSRINQLRLYGSSVTCTDTVFDGENGWIPFRILVTKSEGTTEGRFESCTFRGRGLCALGGCIVFLHSPPAEMEFTDCRFEACGLIPFLGHLKTVEREGCFFGLGWALWLCIIAFCSLVILLVRHRRRRKAWVCKGET